MDVQALGHLGVGLSGHDPVRAVELVAAVVHRHDVHQHHVLGALVQPAHAHLERREHASARTPPDHIHVHVH